MSSELPLYSSILVIDDHNMVVISLRLLIGHLFESFYHTRVGADGIELAIKVQPQLVIVDNQLPDLAGDIVVRQIKAHCPHTRVLGYSFTMNGAAIRKMSGLGADGYVDKSEPDTELTRAVEELMKGNKYFSKEARGHMY